MGEQKLTEFLKLKKRYLKQTVPEPNMATSREIVRLMEACIKERDIYGLQMKLKKVLYVGKATAVLLLDMWDYDLFVVCTIGTLF